MTAISSSLTKADDGTSLVQRASLQLLAGVEVLLTRAEFDAMVTAERARISGNSVGIYPAGERRRIIGEAGTRVWFLATGGSDAANAAASHMRTVEFGQGNSLVLGADANVALAAASVAALPASGAGSANGDVGVVWGTGIFVRTAGAWPSTPVISFASAAGVSASLLSRIQAIESGANYYGNQQIGVMADSFGVSPILLPNLVAQKLGASLALNAVSGRCVAHGTDNAEGDGTSRIPAVDAVAGFMASYPNIKVFVLAVGTNDFHYSVPVGTSTSTDYTTFAGALNTVINLVRAYNSSMRIVFVIPCVRSDTLKNGTLGGSANVAAMKVYTDMMTAIAQREGITIADEFNNPDMAFANLGANTADGIHPSTPLGKARYYTFFANALQADTLRPTIVKASTPTTTTARVYFSDSIRTMSLTGLSFFNNGTQITASGFTEIDSDTTVLPMSVWDFTLPTFSLSNTITMSVSGAAAVDYAGNTLADVPVPIVINAGSAIAYVRSYINWAVDTIGTPETIAYDASAHNLYVSNSSTTSQGYHNAASSAAQPISPLSHTGEIGRFTIPVTTRIAGQVSGLATAVPLTGSTLTFNGINFAMYNDDVNVRVFELGTQVFTKTAATGSSQLDIVVTPTQVTYYENNTLIYTSTVTPTFPLYPAASLKASGAASSVTITNATVSRWNG